MTNIILTAIITFLFSGIGGILFQRFLNKPKPSISINDILFRYYEDETVELGEDLLELIRAIPWIIDDSISAINKRLCMREIAFYRDRLRWYLRNLESACDDCEKWMEVHNHEAKRRKGTPQLYINDVKKHPFFSHPIVKNSIIGDIGVIAIAPPPLNLGEVRASGDKETSPMFDLYQEEIVELWRKDENDRIIVDSKLRKFTPVNDYSISDLVLLSPGGGFFHRFSRSKMEIEDQRCICTILAESFSRCVEENIFHYTKEFIDHSHNEMLRMKQIEAKLDNFIESRFTIFIELSAYNFGQTATAIDSLIGLKIFNRVKGKNMLFFKAETISSGDISPSSENQPVQNRYISLNSRSSYRITLKLVDNSIGMEEIKTLKGTYDAGELKCRLLAKTDTRKTIVTEAVEFGAEASVKSYDELKKVLEKLRR